MEQEAIARKSRVSARKSNQDHNLFNRLMAAATASRGQAQRLLHAAGGLSITEWRILWDLDTAGPLSVQDMASIQRTDHSLISRALSGMRDKGHVTMARSAGDKRQSLVNITESGKRAFERAEPIMQSRRAALKAAIPDNDKEVFLALITRFEAFLEQPIEHDVPFETQDRSSRQTSIISKITPRKSTP